MFTERPKIERSSGHYAVWCWTYSNLLWDKPIKEWKSICQYFWRVVLFGLATLCLHVLYLPLKWIFYDLLYVHIARYATKHVFLGSVLVWLMVGAILAFTRWEALPPAFVGGMALLLAALAVFGVMVYLVYIIIKAAIRFLIAPVIRFDWQMFRRYYVPTYKLEPGTFRYEKFGPMVRHILYWIQPILLLLLGYGGHRTGVVLPNAASTKVLLECTVVMLGSYTILTAITFWILKKRLEHEQQAEMARSRGLAQPVEPTMSEESVPAKSWWDVVVVYLRAKKEKSLPNG